MTTTRILQTVAVIPARGGSKGVPRKNVRLLCGKPLIAWTIEAALGCSFLDRVIVSTDDQEIADIAKEFGAEVPFGRPARLATDRATSVGVLLHALGRLGLRGSLEGTAVAMLQPTSPLRTSEDIVEAMRLLRAKRGDAVVSVSPVAHPPQWCRVIGPDGTLREAHPGMGKLPLRRQDAGPYYLLNGAIYLIRGEILMRERTLFPSRTWPYVMPVERAVDIDTQLDFLLAELLLKTSGPAG